MFLWETEDKAKREAAERRLAKKAEKLSAALESRASDLERMKNALNSDNSEDYSSNEDDKLSCRGSRRSDTPPFSSSDAETEEEFQGKSMPPDFVPTMDTHSATKLPVSSGVAASSSMFGIPAVNPLGGTLGSVPIFWVTKSAALIEKESIQKVQEAEQKI